MFPVRAIKNLTADLQMNKQNSRHTGKSRGIIIIIIVVMLLGITGWTGITFFFLSAVPEPFMVYITPQTTTSQLTEALSIQTGENNAKKIITLASVLGFDSTERTGAYKLSGGMSVYKAASKLSRGSQTPVRFTFNNIRTKEQFADRVSKSLHISKDELLTMLNNDSICNSYGFTSETIPALFIPDTYEFYWTVTPNKFIEKMKQAYDRYWNQERTQKARSIGLTPVETAVIASIVEEETNKKDEMEDVAGLYINRLKQRMKLQADPTVKFALQDFGLRRILKEHTMTPSPYNTYYVNGLPPGPIRFASKTGLDAVLNHKQHNYLYMCAKEDFSGYHNFATTLPEHQRNAVRYHKALAKRNIYK